MSELITKIEGMDKKLDKLISAVHDLSILTMKSKVNDTWLEENTAAKMVGYQPENFRRKVKYGHKHNILPWSLIIYRHTNGRNFQYSKKAIENFLSKTSIE